MSIASNVRLYLGAIKFSHSIFALPFALTSALIAAGGLPPVRKIAWIAVAMIGARSGAMGFNRIIDRRIDALNPRTKNREIPSGRIKASAAVLFSVISFAVFVFAAYMLNPLCFMLSPLAIAVVVGYSYSKRFTWAAHFWLGLSLAIAPVGAWIAVRGSMDWNILPMALAVFFWLPGFDMLYALQDIEFDRSHGIYSIPARFGIRASLWLARFLHGISALFLIINGFMFSLGVWYWIGMAIVAMLFAYEHSLLKENDISRIDMAFLNMNGYISTTVFTFTLLDYIF